MSHHEFGWGSLPQDCGSASGLCASFTEVRPRVQIAEELAAEQQIAVTEAPTPSSSLVASMALQGAEVSLR